MVWRVMWKRIAAGVLGLSAIISGVLGCGYATTAVADFLTAIRPGLLYRACWCSGS
jgi:hypothetical protein